MSNKGLFYSKTCFVVLLATVIFWTSTVWADRPGWERQEVNWRMTGDARIKAVSHPRERPLPTRSKTTGCRPIGSRRKVLPPEAAFRLAPSPEQTTGPLFATVIDSPPVDGFVPWVAVSVTDARFNEDAFIFEAVPTDRVTGRYLSPNPQISYAVGIFDTGASAHVMNAAAAIQARLRGPYLTSNMIEITGVTGSVDAWVSQPIGLFVDGIGAIEPNGLLVDTSGMVGEWNVAVAVGDIVESPGLPTAIGSPIAVYFATEFRNDEEVSITHGSEDFNGPDLLFHEYDDPCRPSYPNIIPLELRPLGGVNVQYIPYIDPFNPFEFPPMTPSMIIGNLYQSIFFVHSVDLYEGDHSAIDKDRFMLDTGAQVTVIGSRVAARLALNPADPDFEVEIQGVSGDSIMAPGFYIDALEIPALGEWLAFTDIPVVWLDVASPEGGTVDGIIGMNLFVEFNFVLRGGGLAGMDDPAIEFGPTPHRIIADIAPRAGDGVVDSLDLAVFARAWLATLEPRLPNWDPKCDMAPAAEPDGKIDFLDFAVIAEYWRDTAP